ncbi:MAG: AAA family ATPase, partial [Proteobacteria bacterium]|nr:AAA family ATPase [Pseudomonadota bacterium]
MLGEPEYLAFPPPELATFVSDQTTSLRPRLDPLADTIELTAALKQTALPKMEPVVAPSAAFRPRTSRLTPPIPQSWRSPLPPPLPAELLDAGLSLFGLRTVPLVGRLRARGVLWQGLHDAARGDPQLIIVRGPSGIGKSRLVEWLCVRAHEVGAATSMGCTFGSASATDGLHRMITRFFSATGLSREAASDRIRDWMTAQKEGRVDVQTLLELVQPSTGRMQLQNAIQRYALFLSFFRRIATTRPLIVWMDDVQWGSDGLELVDYCFQSGDSLPILFMATTNDEALAERPLEAARIDSLLERDGVKALTLQPLRNPERADLVDSLLTLEPALATTIEERSAGSPLFLVQVVNDLVQRQVLHLVEGRYWLKEGETVSLPDDIHGIWTQYVHRVLASLPSDAEDNLWRAAALGMEVDGNDWAAVSTRGSQLIRQQLLDRMLSMRLATETAEGWRFAHGILRECLLRAAAESGRLQDIHSDCAKMLEEQLDQERVAERMGKHLVAAGKLDKALEPLLQGVRERERTVGVRPALALLNVYAKTLKSLGIDDDDQRSVAAQLVKGRLHRADGKLREAVRIINNVRIVALKKGYADLHLSACFFLRRLGARPDCTINYKALMSEWKKAVTGNPLELGKYHYACGTEYSVGPKTRKEHHLALALRYFKEANDQRGIGFTYRNMAMDASVAGNDKRSLELHRKALNIFEEVGFRTENALCYNGFAESYRRLGELDLAEEYYKKAIDLYESVGDAEALFPQVNLGILHVLRQEWMAAL